MIARLARNGVRITAGVAVLFGMLATRVVVSSRTELLEGQSLRKAADTDASIVHLRRAARWYAPGNPYSTSALDELAQIARAAEGDENVDLALEAWRAVRGSIMATRSFYTPHPSRLAEANGRISELMASLPAPAVDAGKSRSEIAREHLTLLEEARGPSMGWTLLLLTGFVLWIVSAFLLTEKGFDPECRIVWREARRWGTLVVVGFALFAAGLYLA